MRLRKLLTLLRGQATEIADTVVDANALRILEQELRDADATAKAAAGELARLMAEEIAVRRRMEATAGEISEREIQAKAALQAGQEALAGEVAERLATLHADRQRDVGTARILHEQVIAIRNAVAEAERRIGDLRHEIVRLRAIEAAQRTEARIGRNGIEIASAVETAGATAERIRARQQRNLDISAACRELKTGRGAGVLDEKLRAAGLVAASAESAASILARLKSELHPPAVAPAH